MERDKLLELNACCINRLTERAITIIKASDLRIKIALGDKSVKHHVADIDELIKNIYKHISLKNYKRAMLFVCLLYKKLDICNKNNI